MSWVLRPNRARTVISGFRLRRRAAPIQGLAPVGFAFSPAEQNSFVAGLMSNETDRHAIDFEVRALISFYSEGLRTDSARRSPCILVANGLSEPFSTRPPCSPQLPAVVWWSNSDCSGSAPATRWRTLHGFYLTIHRGTKDAMRLPFEEGCQVIAYITIHRQPGVCGRNFLRRELLVSSPGALAR